MGKAKGKHRLDKFYHFAKEQGYRSRAAYKIIQLNSKFNILPSARSLLDLCAAPGGWMQVAVKHMPVGSFVLGVDLVHIRPIRGAVSIQGDITTQDCRSAIRKKMGENGCGAFDVILHDGSPNVGGAWAKEATSQAALVVDAVRLASEFLVPKGTFVTKVFRSQDYNAVLYCLKQLFEKVEVTKPTASRSTSAEIYVVGHGYKAPAKIDPRLLDVKHLFQGAIEPPKVMDVLRGTKQKRNREGYEDGASILRKVCLASEFVLSETPLDLLGSVTCISFEDPACLTIKEHPLTTEEIKALCDDLLILGKQDFKLLLKWRMHIRKALLREQKVAAPKASDEEDGMTTQENDDERILNEMEELTYVLDSKKKRAKKLLAKRRAKEKSRTKTGMQIDAMEDGYIDNELFSLSSIKGKKDLQAVDSTEVDYINGENVESESEETGVGEGEEDSRSDIDSDEEHQRYDEQLEEFLDQAYERFVTGKEGSSKQRKRARLALADGSGELWKDTQVGGQDLAGDSDVDQDMEANPLVVPLHEELPLTKEQLTEQWFSQDVFASTEPEEAATKYDGENEVEDVIQDAPTPSISKKLGPNKLDSLSQVSQQDDFEIVPAEGSSSSDDSSSDGDESEYDTDSKAEILAYAKKMLRKKQREQILDDAYNRYTFDDQEGLPVWFLEDEKRHNKPLKPITREEVEAMKAQFREIDARPAKKVAQAKARKKRVAMRKLESVKRKANSISDQTDISERSKTKMIDKLYKKAAPKRPNKEYQVAKKGVPVKPGKGKVLVDPRMKKDMRTHGMGKPGKVGKKKGKGVKMGGKGVKVGGKGGKGKSKGLGGSANKKGKKMGRKK
ncbi:adoMet-dependent rRNA methyltransferase spb1 [Amborella trichopoda]|uniref:Putative rRNA methyltransferase n=1 Tax=Amborella trichopoda TaxID=13333 RepID=W1NHQ0_AMBTC|nr:adoMet-dependent rRNA methyltransferase spb1 [Amborella trichopoda]ERM94685.1 hypothetical protein AMTR_s00011p00229900 [Amborella trichopoda]|eukprot:XP_006878540.1 adoMet-dependent rRNA methyltransferase spb1 [Amborella trichopoda]